MTRGIPLVFLFLIAPMPAMAGVRENVYLWIEAENFTTATRNIRIVREDQALLSGWEKKGEKVWIAKSGRLLERARKVSKDAYVQMGENQEKVERIHYEFTAPFEDEYYIWIRFNDPPPCVTYFNLWLDGAESKRKKLPRLKTGVWGVWLWWGWGDSLNSGMPEALRLKKGEHKLTIGDLFGTGTRFDKILVTNDANYIPLGINEHFYTRTFSPPVWPGSGHGNADEMRAAATGWSPSPERRWTVERGISGNYRYKVSDKLSTDTTSVPAHSLIRRMKCDVFEASLAFVLNPNATPADQDALFLFGFRNPNRFEAVRFGKDSVEYLRVEDGTRKVLAKRFTDLAPRVKPHKATIRRTRTGLVVEVNGSRALSERLSFPNSGAVGIGSYTGGIFFDDITVLPLLDPAADFDFTQADDKTLRDWTLIRSDRKIPYSKTREFKKGDLLLYKASSWSSSEADFLFSGPFQRRISILFPYRDPDNMVETRISAPTPYDPSEFSLEVIQHLRGRKKSRGTENLPVNSQDPLRLSIQSGKGLFALFQNDERIIEANEYDLLEGTIGILFHEDTSTFPLRRIEVRRKNVIIDNFLFSESGSLTPGWRILDGVWKTIPVFEGKATGGDAQLVARGKGTALIGEERWLSYLTQISAHFDENTEIAILGWVREDKAMELYCASDAVEIRKVVEGNPMTLASVSVPDLSKGWHRIGFALGEKGVSAEVDGKEILRVVLKGAKGKAGLRNYGEFATFDNLSIHVTTEEKDNLPNLNPVDSRFADIEKSFLSGK